MAKELNPPSSVRFDSEKMDFIKNKEGLNSVQKVFTFLLDRYWWEHKITVIQQIPINEVPTNVTYDSRYTFKPPKQKIVRTEQYFLNIIKNGFELPQEHMDFIQEVNESDLSERIKQNLITASRTKQS